MDKYIHRENLALFKRRITDAKDEAAREMAVKLLAEEQAKDTPHSRRNRAIGALAPAPVI